MEERYRWQTAHGDKGPRFDYYDTERGLMLGIIGYVGDGAYRPVVYDQETSRWVTLCREPMEYLEAKRLIETTVRLTN
jgi:hypothetical protein